MKKGSERGDYHEKLPQGIMVQHSHPKGFRKYHPSGGGVSEGKRGPGRARARERNAHVVKQTVPFMVAGRYAEGSAAASR